MKTLLRSFFFLFLVFSQFVHADGIILVQGKVISLSPKEVVIEVAKKQLYTIRRTELLKKDSDKLTRSEIQVSLNVPMDAIVSVKDAHPKRH
jgi:hypothetical protein